MDNNFNSNYQTGYQPEIRCPGKEIAALVLGINALVWGIFSLLFCWYIALSIAYMFIGLGCGIAALVLFKKIQEQATVIAPKAYTAKKLATVGIICSCVGLVFAIIFIAGIAGAGLLEEFAMIML